MADAGQSAFAEPMTMQEALGKFETQLEEKQDNLETPEEAPQEAAKPVETEVEAEVDAETEDAKQEPEPQEDDGPQVLTASEYGEVLVDVNGTATTINDLIKGNLWQADYTRKSQANAEALKRGQAEIAEKEQALADRERQLNERLAQLDGEPDWVKLAEEDPLGYAEQRARWDVKKAEADKAKADLDAQTEKARQEFVRQTATVAMEKFPEWQDAKKFDEGAEARKAAALSAGFTEAEYATAADFRLSVLLEKAARYDAMRADTGKKQVAAEKRIAKAPKVLKPGASKGPVDANAERAAARKQRFSKDISSDDIRRMLGR